MHYRYSMNILGQTSKNKEEKILRNNLSSVSTAIKKRIANFLYDMFVLSPEKDEFAVMDTATYNKHVFVDWIQKLSSKFFENIPDEFDTFWHTID